MAYGNPVSFWYGTKAQYDSIGTKLADILYFITDEQALYKGDVKFSGSGVETLIKVDDAAPTSASKYDRYFNTSDGLIHVLNTDGTDLSTYTPADGALYYDVQLKRFVTLTKNGSAWDVNTIYDAGISVTANTGLELNGTVLSGITATKSVKGVVQIGDNINVTNGTISVNIATSNQFGLVKIGSNINVADGVISVAIASASVVGLVYVSGGTSASNGVTLALNTTTGALTVTTAKATASAFGTVQIGTNIDVADGVISVKTGSTSDKGIVKIGTNIDVDANGVISVKTSTTSQKGVVQLVDSTSDTSSTDKAVTPHYISTVAGTKQDNLTAGYRTDLSGNTVSQLRYMDIETVSGATITFLAGHAYKIQATDTKKLVTETIPANKFGLEGHAEIFVTDTGFITTADNVVLVDALEPNAVNNCTLRFHDGMCLISVEDHVAGYIVRSVSGTSAGSLYAALADTTKEYISVDASLNGHLLETDEAVLTVTKMFVGNGTEVTTVEGDMTLNAAFSMVECTVKPMNLSGSGSISLANAVLDFTDATSAEPIGLTGGVKIGANVTIIDGSGNTKHLDPRAYGTIKKDGTTTPAQYVYGYAQGLTQAKDNYIPIVLASNVISKVDALDASKMSCHERRVCVMDDCSEQHVNYYLNPENLNKKLDGGDAVLDGTDGDVMTEVQPYYRLEIQMIPQNSIEERKCVLMSRYPFSYTDSNNVEHVAARPDVFKISPDGQTYRPQYMGYYQASTVTDNGVQKLRSISSKSTAYIYPTVSLKLGPVGSDGDSTDSFLNRAIANGGSVCNELHYEMLFDLFVCQKLTVNTQDTTKGSLGFGWASTTSWGSFYPRACGYTNETENFYGGSTYADSRDTDMEAMWQGSWIKTTTDGVTTQWNSDAAGCVVVTDQTTGKRSIACNRWRSGAGTTENPYAYLYTKASDGMPTTSTQLYTDNTCETASSLTISSVYAGVAYANRVTACKYFVENPWGSIWQNLAGFLPICTGNNIGYFRTTSTNRYKELLKIPISEAGTSRAAADGNAAIEWVSFAWPASGWITTWNMETFLPTSTGTNVMQDYFYNSTTASPRAGFRGGRASHTSNGGLGSVFVGGAVGSATDYIGARLSA